MKKNSTRLSKEETDKVRRELEEKSVRRSFLYEEFVDHVCCDIENLMNTGMDFRTACRTVIGTKGSREIRQAHELTVHLLNHRYVLAKKLLWLALILFAVSWLLVPAAAGWTGLASFLVLGVVYLRIGNHLFRERHRHKSGISMSIMAFLSFIGTVEGIILIFLNRNFGMETRGHGVDLTVFSWFFFSLLCLIYYGGQHRHSIDHRAKSRNGFLGWLSGINLFLAMVAIATFPLYAVVSDYIYILIIVILAFDLVSILWLLAGRYMKNTLAVTLVAGSFMTVFIHSGFRSLLPGGKPRMHSITLTAQQDPDRETNRAYLYFYYDKFRDHPFLLPMKKGPDGNFSLTLPSYPYRGYLVFSIRQDSTKPGPQPGKDLMNMDSVLLNVPKQLDYKLPLDHPSGNTH